MRGCTAAHKCSNFNVPHIVIAGDSDSKDSVDADGIISSQPLSVTGEFQVQAWTEDQQDSSTYLVSGVVTEADFKTLYHSGASASFKPYIVDAEATLSATERRLFGRVREIQNNGFYITTLTNHRVEGRLVVSVRVPEGYFDPANDTKISLLTWCAKEEVWIAVEHACDQMNNREEDDMTVYVFVCNIAEYCSHQTGRKREKRDNSLRSNHYTGPQAFLAVSMLIYEVNTSPFMTSPTVFTVRSDKTYVLIRLRGNDAEGDAFSFYMDPEYSIRGTAELVGRDVLKYQPCEACTGVDYVKIYLREDGAEVDQPLQTEVLLQLNLEIEVNEPPKMYIIKHGADVLASGSVEFTADEYSPSNQLFPSTKILVLGFDLDVEQLRVVIGEPSHGSATITRTVQRSVVGLSCEPGYSGRWREMEVQLLEGGGEVDVLVPCNIDSEIVGAEGAWLVALVEYQAEADFYGPDSFPVSYNHSLY